MFTSLSGIVVWGDSIGKGIVWSEEHLRYRLSPRGCVRRLAGLAGCPVKNLSVMGCTADECLKRFDPAQTVPGGVGVIELGGNDCNMPWEAISRDPEGEYLPCVPLERYTAAMRRLIFLLRRGGMVPAVAVPVPVVGHLYLSSLSRFYDGKGILRYLGDAEQISRWQERWASAARTVALEENATLIDLRDAMLRNRRFETLYCRDGIHLNDEGQEYLLKYILDYYGEVRTAS